MPQLQAARECLWVGSPPCVTPGPDCEDTWTPSIDLMLTTLRLQSQRASRAAWGTGAEGDRVGQALVWRLQELVYHTQDLAQ
jgi:hypothetical protein